MLRSRLRVTDPVPFVFSTKGWHLGQLVSSSQSTPEIRYLSSDHITDVGGSRSDNIRNENPCSHRKIRTVCKDCVIPYKSDAAGDWTGEFSYTGSAIVYNTTTPETLPTPELPVGWLEGCHNDFLTAVDESIKSKGIQLLNFMWELRDLRHITTSMLPSVSSLATKLADVTLLTTFALEPLRRDLTTLLGMLDGVADRIAWLKSHVGQPVIVRFGRNTEFETPFSDPTALDTWTNTFRVGTAEANYRGKAVVTYDLTTLDIDLLSGTMIRRRLGLDKLKANIWNSLPWTFVLDWLVRIGQLLERLDDYEHLPVVVHQCTWSLKLTWGLQYEAWAPQRYNPGVYGVRANAKCIWYDRNVGLPTKVQYIQAGSLGLQQLALGLALFQSRFGYRNVAEAKLG